MNPDSRLSIVENIMTEFARATGLASKDLPSRRYLWTDAFAVCNFLALYTLTGNPTHRDLAARLVDAVHHELGRHRADDARTGWISGLDEREGGIHPTAGGLRIGKPMNERRLEEPYDDRLEWDRDGQYFHYLTKWMRALNRASRVTGDVSYHRWAVELARSAHSHFCHAPGWGRGKRIYWKMSIDLSYPLVTSMGHHDPLDALLTYNELQAVSRQISEVSEHIDLTGEIRDMARLCAEEDWATDDSLGIGGILTDAYRVAQLTAGGMFIEPTSLLETLLEAAGRSLAAFTRSNSLRYPAEHRLAFRELGLSIGLRALPRLTRLADRQPGILSGSPACGALLTALQHQVPLADTIETYWLEPVNQETRSWSEHREINRVMLATSLAPDGYLSV